MCSLPSTHTHTNSGTEYPCAFQELYFVSIYQRSHSLATSPGQFKYFLSKITENEGSKGYTSLLSPDHSAILLWLFILMTSAPRNGAPKYQDTLSRRRGEQSAGGQGPHHRNCGSSPARPHQASLWSGEESCSSSPPHTQLAIFVYIESCRSIFKFVTKIERVLSEHLIYCFQTKSEGVRVMNSTWWMTVTVNKEYTAQCRNAYYSAKL